MVNRYPLVCYFDEDTTGLIRDVQRTVADLTGATASLREWAPHISAGSEIWLDDDKEQSYVAQLQAATQGIGPIKCVMDGYGFMDDWPGGKLAGFTSNVVYIKVIVTDDLQRLVTAIRAVTDTYDKYYEMPLPYNPHVTVAFKDLTSEGFCKAKKLLSTTSFQHKAKVDGVSIVKHAASGLNEALTAVPLKQTLS